MPDDAIERAKKIGIQVAAECPDGTAPSIVTAAASGAQLGAMLAFASQQAPAETVSLDDGFTIDLDDDDFTVCWPDGRWLVAQRSGKVTVGKSPFDKAVPPKQTTLSAMLDAAPSVTLGEVG